MSFQFLLSRILRGTNPSTPKSGSFNWAAKNDTEES